MLVWLALLATACSNGPTYVLRVEVVSADGAAHVTSVPGGLDCALPCEERFPEESTVVVTIEAGARSRFVRWDDPACGTSPSCTITLGSDRTLGAELELTTPRVALSELDRDPGLVLRDDRLAASFYESGGVRSTHGIAPGSGVYYVEMHRLAEPSGLYGFGVASMAAPLLGAMVGMTDQSFGMTADGVMYYAGAWVGRTNAALSDRVGFVVDYRGATPTVHVIGTNEQGALAVLHTQRALTITTDLYVYLIGQRRSTSFEVEINPGNDTTNAPFALDARAILQGAGLGEVAGALTLGWGMTFAGDHDQAPVIDPLADRTVPLGTEVTLTARATDAEDGDLSGAIQWELLSSPHFAGRVRGEGPSFTFVADAIGIHPALARVRDAVGHVTELVVKVEVPGPVTMVDTPRLVPDDLSGPGVILSDDGLSARWTDEHKSGVRANQSLYGAFWYFEIERLVDPINQGGGIVIGGGNLAPYSWADTPPSMSINTSDGVYRNLLWHSNFPEPAASYTSYGFAVDYRGEHPIVYVIAGGEVVDELALDDVWVEIYPMLYGNPTGASGFDESVRFGPPFEYDPRAALAAHGADASELVVGWGS